MRTSSGAQRELADGPIRWQHVSALSPVLWWNTKGSWRGRKNWGTGHCRASFDGASSCCCCGGGMWRGLLERVGCDTQNANTQKFTKRTKIHQTNGNLFKRTSNSTYPKFVPQMMVLAYIYITVKYCKIMYTNIISNSKSFFSMQLI